MKSVSDLTEREHKYLEHVERARARGQSLAQYCRDAGISVQDLYSAKQQLTRKGALCEQQSSVARRARSRDFIPVRVTGVSPGSTSIVCRLQHPGGWILECASWPHPQWLAAVFEGAGDASP